MKIGVQTQNIVNDDNISEGFELLKKAGFSCCDFSLNAYLKNTMIYRHEINDFFSKSRSELEKFFTPHKNAAKHADVVINQMHMPYPLFIPDAGKEVNDYMRNVVAPKSMGICAFFECPYIVVHGLKLARNIGSDQAEWKYTEEFLSSLAQTAKETNIKICIENLYTSVGSHIVEGPCCNAKKAAERIDRFNDKFGAEILGFCFDTGHANLVGIDVESFIKTLGKRLKVLHIHDNDGLGDLHQIPFTFTRNRENKSSTDWDGFIRGLRSTGFDGVLSFETAPVLTAFPDKMECDVLELIAKTGRYFSDEILK